MLRLPFDPALFRVLVVSLSALGLTAHSFAQNGAPVQPPAVPSGPTWEVRERPRSEPPPVRVEPDVLDLGDLPINSRTPGVFKLTNTGDTRLEIAAAMSTCWCTNGTPSKNSIEPGETIELPITFDAGPVMVRAERDITVRFSGYARAVRCPIRADVHYGVRARVEYDPPEQRRIGVVTLEDPQGDPFVVVSANKKPPEFFDGFDPSRDTPRSKYQVRFDLSGIPAEKLPWWYLIELDHPEAPVIDLPIENLEYEPRRMRRPWRFDPGRVLLGNIEPATNQDVYVVMQNIDSGAIDAIERIDITPPIAQVQVMGMERGESGLRVRLRVAPAADHRGLLALEVVVVAQGHDELLTILGRVAPAR